MNHFVNGDCYLFIFQVLILGQFTCSIQTPEKYNRNKTVIVHNLASRLEDHVYISTYNVIIFAINDQNDISI